MTYHRFVTRLTRRVPLVEQKLFTLPEHLSSSPVCSRVPVTRSLVLYVCLIYRSLFVLLYFFIWPLCCLLRYADSDYSLWYIFKLFLTRIIACTVFSFEGFVSVPKNAYKTPKSFTWAWIAQIGMNYPVFGFKQACGFSYRHCLFMSCFSPEQD